MRSKPKAAILGALATMILVLGSSLPPSGAATPLGEFTTRATAGVTPGFAPASQPQAMTVGPDGLMWFTDFTSVNRINADGTVTNFDAEPEFGALPVLFNIVTGPDGNLWFSKFDPPGQVGKITPDGTITAMTTFADGNLQDIINGPDGNLWYTKPFATGVIGRITTAGVTTEFTPPNPGAQPREMAVGPDGNIWYTDDGDPGRILSAAPDGTITQVAEAGVTPGFSAGFKPFAIALGPDGNMWATLFSPGGSAVLQITPTGRVTEFTTAGLDFLFGIVSACGDLFLSQSTEGGGEAAIWRLTTAGAFTQYTAGLPAGAAPFGLAQGPDEDVWIAAAGTPGRVLTMGAGCADEVPTSTTAAAATNAVAPRFTG